MQFIQKHIFENSVFRCQPDEGHRSLLLEVRDKTNKRVNFKSIDVKNGILWFSGFESDFDWSTTGQHIWKDNLVLSKIKSPDIPAPEGIEIWNLKCGKKIWENQKAVFTQAENRYLFFNEEANHYQLDLESFEQLKKEATSTHFTSETSEIYWPDVFYKGNENWNHAASVIHHFKGHVPIMPIDYLETSGYICISYYICPEKETQHFLLVLSHNGKEELHFQLSEQVKGYAQDPFVIWFDKLIFIKNTHEVYFYQM